MVGWVPSDAETEMRSCGGCLTLGRCAIQGRSETEVRRRRVVVVIGRTMISNNNSRVS